MAEEKTVTINGTAYELNQLSEEARQQITNLQLTDREIERLNTQVTIMKTARNAYLTTLQSLLPEQDSSTNTH